MQQVQVSGIVFEVELGTEGATVKHRGRVLAQRAGHVQVRHLGRPRRVSVARLVLTATVGPPPADGMVPIHENGAGADCRPGNLRWGTRAEALRAHTADRRAGAAGERNGAAKLTGGDAEAIRASTEPRRVLASRYDITVSQVGRIQRGECW